MEFVILICAIGLAISTCVFYYERSRNRRRGEFLQSFMPPPELLGVLRVRHPHLSNADCETVARGLRQFFLAHHQRRKYFLAMPSQVADDLWHEMILSTRLYEDFCRRAFGKTLHHTPAHAVGGGRKTQQGLRRAWKLVCEQESIDYRKPSRLPLLFALDGALAIQNGFVYLPDCSEGLRQGATLGAGGTTGVYCAAGLCADGVTAADWSGDIDCGGGVDCGGGCGGAGACSGGCGGGGCGGGCGGGD